MTDDFFRSLADLIVTHPGVVLATVVSKDGSAPREAGARMAVMPDGSILGTVGGGSLEKQVIEDALAVMRDGRPRLAAYDLVEEAGGGVGAACGGRTEVFLEPLGSAPHLLVVGAGHVGLALARLGDRAGFADKASLAGATVVRYAADDPSIRNLVTEGTAVVVVTHSHLMDRQALGNLLGTDAFYIGMIGSRRKVAAEMKVLEDEGAPADRLRAVHAPIGLDIGAETPAEIAVSILAEIVALRRTGSMHESSLTVKKGAFSPGDR
jgi:xanthine dehydrogenase accessory factor